MGVGKEEGGEGVGVAAEEGEPGAEDEARVFGEVVLDLGGAKLSWTVVGLAAGRRVVPRESYATSPN